MEILFYFLSSTVFLIIQLVQLLMLVRAILSFLPIDDRSPILAFVYMVTEPVIFPMRVIFDRFGIGEGLPIDLPFLATYLLLTIVSILL